MRNSDTLSAIPANENDSIPYPTHSNTVSEDNIFKDSFNTDYLLYRRKIAMGSTIVLSIIIVFILLQIVTEIDIIQALLNLSN